MKTATYVDLKEKAEDLMRQAEAAPKAEISAVLADIKAKMATYGIDAVISTPRVKVVPGTAATADWYASSIPHCAAR